MATGTELLHAPNRGMTARHEFGGSQIQSSAETAIAAVAARERAEVEAQYLMAERHPRNWDDVRVRLLSHCSRPGFAEIARYKKPAGKKKIDGQWKETFAEGLSARFAEIARQEAGNLSMGTNVVYEDDLIRIVRIFVTDTERNNKDSREVSIAKVVEKRGKQNKSTQEWEPPEGRDVIGNPRLNSYGEPVYLCKATDDEVRAKQNSEISKTQRDESLRLIPKDIRDDCEATVLATLADPKKVDPIAARKKIIDAFARLGRLPSDLENYIGAKLDRISPLQVDELRGLYAAINDGETTFEEAMRRKWDADYTPADREAVLEEKLATAEKATRSATQAQSQSDPTTYDRDTLPDAAGLRVGTEVLYKDGNVIKRLRAEQESPDSIAEWKTVEEVSAQPKPAEPVNLAPAGADTGSGNPAPRQGLPDKPVFGKGRR